MFQKSGFKTTPVVLPLTNMQGLVEDAMYVYQGEILMFGEDA